MTIIHRHSMLPNAVADREALREALQRQIAGMVERHEDYILDAAGVDADIHVVANLFEDGVWLMAHHDTCNMHRWTRVQRLA